MWRTRTSALHGPGPDSGRSHPTCMATLPSQLSLTVGNAVLFLDTPRERNRLTLPVWQILDGCLRILRKVEFLFRDRVHFACFYVQIGRYRIVGHFERFNDHVELHFSSHGKPILLPIRPRVTVRVLLCHCSAIPLRAFLLSQSKNSVWALSS